MPERSVMPFILFLSFIKVLMEVYLLKSIFFCDTGVNFSKMSDKAEMTNKNNTSDTSLHKENRDITLIPGEKISFDVKAFSADNNRTTSPFSLENCQILLIYQNADH